jgi:hypothetical protein
MIYLVEIIRYGNPSLGVHRYGVFDDFAKIAPTMAEYNSYRGGKYPAYFVTEFSEMNPSDTDFPERKRYEVTYAERVE